MITVIAGGVGAARYLVGQLRATPPEEVTAIVNVGDDTVLHGLHVSPDLDTVIYTVAGAINSDTGWGLADETWNAMAELRSYGHDAWFNLGDRDLGTHLFRTSLLREGHSLSEVTARLASARGLGCTILPASDDRIETRVTLDSGTEIGFQEYFVRLEHDVAIQSVRFAGIEAARPAPGVLEAIDSAEVLVIAPSNPIVSIAPVIEVPGVSAAVAARRDRNVAVSPIVDGAALKGPADRMLRELGEEATVVGVARRYRHLVANLVIDEADAHHASAIEAEGVGAIVTPTIMSTPEIAQELAEATVSAVGRRP